MRTTSLAPIALVVLSGCQVIAGIEEKVYDNSPQSGGTGGTSGASQAGAGGSGQSASAGTSGTAGAGAFAGTAGHSGTSATGGVSGTSGAAGTGATGGSAGLAGTSGTSGMGGTSGSAGQSGSGGLGGSSGTGGSAGTGGTGGTAGIGGASGNAGTGGIAGTAGIAGSGGTSGMSGTGGSGGVTCEEGKGQCDGSILSVCLGGTLQATPCTGATPYCDAAQARCEPCLPGEVVKTGVTLDICDDDGGAFVTEVCNSDIQADYWEGLCVSDGTVSQIVAGRYFACARLQSGQVQCWGENGASQLADGTTTDRYSPVVANVAGTLAIAAGDDHVCALLSDHTVTCWGSNTGGQLGTPPVPGNPLITDVQAVAAGYRYSCALKNDNTVWCWGRNADGSLGDGTTTNRPSPTQVPGLLDATEIFASAMATTTCAKRMAGEIYCWGNDVLNPTQVATEATRVAISHTATIPSVNEVIVLQHSNGAADYVKRSAMSWGPPISILSSGVSDISGGPGPCYVLTDQSTLCSAQNTTTIGAPALLSTLGPGSSKSIVTGYNFHCAQTNSNNVACLGTNDRGQIGNGKTSPVTTPHLLRNVGLVQRLRLGLSSGFAILPGGITRVWGTAGAFNLVEPVPTQNGLVGNDLKQITLGNGIAYLRRNDDGQFFVQNGIATAGTRLLTTGELFLEAYPRSDRDFGFTDNHELKFYAVTTGGNSTGIFGTGQTGTSSGVVATTPLSNVAEVAYYLDTDTTTNHMCALLNDQTIRCWGRSQEGQVGNGQSGSGVNIPTPTEPTWGVPKPAISKVVVGALHTCALDSEGSVYCWGSNTEKQLGFANSSSTPVKLAGISGAIGLAAGEFHNCVWFVDGSVKCWGRNDEGQLGNGTIVDAPTPINITALSNVREIAMRDQFTCAVHFDGRVSCWGLATSSRLGDNYQASYSEPQFVLGL